MKRSGTKWIWNTVVPGDAARVFPFEYSTTQAYAVIAGDLTFRFIKNYDILTQTAQAITAVTKANPAVVTYTGSDTYANGDKIKITGVLGMTELNNREFTVANVNIAINTFELSGVDSSAYTAYTSAGTVAEIYQITSPYTAAQLADVSIAQGANVVYFFHPSVAPYKLTRTADTSWTMAALTLNQGPLAATNGDESVRVWCATASAVASDFLPGKTVTINANASIFESGHVGGLFHMEEIFTDITQTAGTYIAPWAATQVVGAVIGTQVSNEGNVYSLANAGTGTSTGTIAPTHTEGDAWDNVIAATNVKQWRYLHSRSCYLRIASFVSATQVTATILSYMPHGFHPAATTITGAVSSGGLILITAAAHGLSSGDYVVVAGVTGTTEANGNWRVTYVSATQFTLDGSAFVNAYAAAGTVRRYATWIWSLGAFSTARGFPVCGTIFNDRLCLASTTAQPDSLWCSVVGDYEDHSESFFGVVRDDAAIAVTLSSPKVNRVRWLSTDAGGLVAGSAGAEFILRPATTSKPFAPSNVEQRPNSAHGSRDSAPVSIGSGILFIQRAGKKIHELIFDSTIDRYVSNDLTLVANDITKAGLTELAFVQEPDNIVYGLRTDGRLVGLTYDREQQITGFHLHTIGGKSDAGGTNAIVESLCVLPSPDGSRDDLYMVVKRYRSGAVVRSVEYHDRSWDITTGDIEDQYFVDGGLTYSGASTTTITGLPFLAGETLSCLADGSAHADVVVSSLGVVTLTRAATVVQLGYGYSGIGTLLPLDVGSQDGTASGKAKKVSKLRLWLYRSATFEAGPDASNLDTVVMRESDDPLDTATALVTGIKELAWPDGYSMEAPIMVRQSLPMALVVMALMPVVTTHDGT